MPIPSLSVCSSILYVSSLDLSSVLPFVFLRVLLERDVVTYIRFVFVLAVYVKSASLLLSVLGLFFLATNHQFVGSVLFHSDVAWLLLFRPGATDELSCYLTGQPLLNDGVAHHSMQRTEFPVGTGTYLKDTFSLLDEEFELQTHDLMVGSPDGLLW